MPAGSPVEAVLGSALGAEPGEPVAVEGLEAFRAEVLESPLPVVVDFGAPWCAPCRAIAPVMVELARELAGQVKVVTVDTDENQELARAYGITTIPTLLFFHAGGELSHTAPGARPKRSLRELARKLLETGEPSHTRTKDSQP